MSTTTNLKLFKHDNPTTNTEQFDVEKALNENWDKIDVNAGAVLEEIEELNKNSTTQSTEIKSLKEQTASQTIEIQTLQTQNTQQTIEIESLKSENTLLKSQIPSATVVGETVHLEDSSNMPCQITPLGASKQETREGYNKANYNDSRNDSNSNFDIGDVESGKSYTLVLDIIGTISYNLRYSTSQNIVKTEYSRTGQVIINFDATETDKLIFNGFSGVEYTGMKIMLLEGTFTSENLPEYEQYGASPSIEFEAPIESVGDNIQLFDKDNASKINGYIDNNGYFQYNTDNKIAYIECKKNKDYAVSSKYLKGIAFLNEVPKTGLTSTNFKIQNTTELTLNSGNNAYLAVWYYNASSTLTEQEIIDSIKIVEGTSTGAYSPYGQGSIEIVNCNKNLYQLSEEEINFTVKGVTFTAKNSKLVINGTSTATIERTDFKNKFKKIKLSGIYRFTEKRSETLPTGVYSGLSYTSNYYNSRGTGEIEVENEEFAPSLYIPTNVTFNNYTIEYQIEKGSTATEYVEHQSQTKALYTQQPFRAIGDVKDRFFKKDGVWYEEHKIAELILNGNETWTWHNDNFAFTTLKGLANTPITETLVMSNYLLGVEHGENGNVWKNNNGIIFSWNSANILCIKDTNNFSDVETLKTKLAELYNAGTPLYVDYLLAEPLLIPCTPEQVEVLESFNTYKNVTNISSDSIGELEVFYYKDLETLLGGA